MTIATGHGDWRAAGACMRADPDLFFPISATGRALEQTAKAKAICAGCRVRQECLDFAHQHDVAHGIWGGTTPEDRQQARWQPRRPHRESESLCPDRLPRAVDGSVCWMFSREPMSWKWATVRAA
jgi:WhiB family transcriptional regulator, redox-sensing transcriptional regulator